MAKCNSIFFRFCVEKYFPLILSLTISEATGCNIHLRQCFAGVPEISPG